METNTYGAIRVINTMLPLLLQSKRGRIVNVSSGAGALATMSPDTPAYNLSKVALNTLTKMYAEKFSPNDILVNSVCPGRTFTDMGRPLIGESDRVAFLEKYGLIKPIVNPIF